PDAGSRTERHRHNPHSRDRHPAGSLNPASMRSRSRLRSAPCRATSQKPPDSRFGNDVLDVATAYTPHLATGREHDGVGGAQAQLASDRTSCRSPLANQMRLILHTAAYWLLLTVRDAIPRTHALAISEFTTLRLRLLKLGVRVIEVASRVRLAFAAACPDATLIRHLAGALMPTGP